MVEHFTTPATGSKSSDYEVLIPQIRALVKNEKDLIANLANISAALKEGMDFFWIGFYLIKDHELVLGPFQGPVACTRIQKGKGVCGTAWNENKTLIVSDVDAFPGHITCSAQSKSEIVLPAKKEGEVFLLLDVDSRVLKDFDGIDEKYLSQVIAIIEGLI
jgi:GAF domain-containing protein